MPSVSSYLTSYGISPGMMRAATPSISTFSTTSYYLTNHGVLEQCSPTVPPCNFTYVRNGRTYNVDEYNAMIQNETVARAQPLLFSNSGDMVASFRALANRTSGIADAANIFGGVQRSTSMTPSKLTWNHRAGLRTQARASGRCCRIA